MQQTEQQTFHTSSDHDLPKHLASPGAEARRHDQDADDQSERPLRFDAFMRVIRD